MGWMGSSGSAAAAERSPRSVPRQEQPRSVVAWRACDPAAGVRPGPTQKQAADRGRVARPAGYRSERKQLVQAQIAVEDVAAGQAVFPLQVEWREGVHVLDRGADVGRTAVLWPQARAG